MNPFVACLESAIDGTQFPPGPLYSTHAGRPLWVRYDLNAIAQSGFRRESLADRSSTMWRYRELLPPGDDEPVVSLGECMSPVLRADRLGQKLGLNQLWIKDESQLPTGSFKSRGMAMAMTMARQLGVKRVALPSAGNAGGAAAAYAARAGLEAFVFMPGDTPVVNQYEAAAAGAHVFLVRGLINDCGRIVREHQDAMNWFDLSTLKEPWRLEGKKTMGLELAEQFDWSLPDVIVYPTGGGTGLIGMWKAFRELQQLGWLTGSLPRMVSVQSDGCCPIVRAWESGSRHAELFPNAATIASGLRVPAAVGDFMILDALKESHGTAVAVEESRLPDWMKTATRLEGISFCPEAAACVGACELLRQKNWMTPDDRVVIFNTGAAQKYVEALRTNLPWFEESRSLAAWQS